MSAKPKCKLCGEQHWSSEPHVFYSKSEAKRVTALATPVTPVTPQGDTITTVTTTPDDDVTYVSVLPLPGEPCPTCHRKMPSKNAQRQAAWRRKS